MIIESYISRISTRKVNSLVEALGGQSGISKPQVSRIYQEEPANAGLPEPTAEEQQLRCVGIHAPGFMGQLAKAQ